MFFLLISSHPPWFFLSSPLYLSSFVPPSLCEQHGSHPSIILVHRTCFLFCPVFILPSSNISPSSSAALRPNSSQKRIGTPAACCFASWSCDHLLASHHLSLLMACVMWKKHVELKTHDGRQFVHLSVIRMKLNLFNYDWWVYFLECCSPFFGAVWWVSAVPVCSIFIHRYSKLLINHGKMKAHKKLQLFVIAKY